MWPTNKKKDIGDFLEIIKKKNNLISWFEKLTIGFIFTGHFLIDLITTRLW